MSGNEDKGAKLASLVSAGLVGRDIVTRAAADAADFDVAAAVFEALDGRQAQIATLKAQLAAQKGQVTRVRKVAEALEAQMPDKPRKFAPLKSPLDGREIAGLLGDAEDIEIAFVGEDGSEVADLAPRTLSGDALELRGSRLFLNVPSLLVHGPRVGGDPYIVTGYALLLDGELVALSERPDRLVIPGGAQFQLNSDVAFG